MWLWQQNSEPQPHKSYNTLSYLSLFKYLNIFNDLSELFTLQKKIHFCYMPPSVIYLYNTWRHVTEVIFFFSYK